MEKLYKKGELPPSLDAIFLAPEVMAFAKQQNIRNLASLHALLISFPSVAKLLPEGMYERTMQELEKKYATSPAVQLQKRTYDLTPPAWAKDLKTPEDYERYREEHR